MYYCNNCGFQSKSKIQFCPRCKSIMLKIREDNVPIRKASNPYSSLLDVKFFKIAKNLFENDKLLESKIYCEYSLKINHSNSQAVELQTKIKLKLLEVKNVTT